MKQRSARMVIGEGDTVVSRVKITATQSGDYLGAPPTGRQATWQAVGIDRFRDGKVVERMAVFDPLSLMRQLGHTRLPLA